MSVDLSTLPPAWRTELDRLRALVRANQDREALRGIHAALKRRPPREAMCTLAWVARHVGQAELALSFLVRRVRPTGRRAKPATPEETAEYAARLARAGSRVEARTLLEQVDPADFPGIWMYRGIARVLEWRSDEAIPLFEKALARPGLDAYANLGIRVRLARALIHGSNRWDEAQAMLTELLRETSPSCFGFLHADALIFSLRLAFYREDLSAIPPLLARARRAIPPDTHPQFSADLGIWEGLCGLLISLRKKGEPDRAALDRLHRSRDAAIAGSQWELARLGDLEKAILLRDARLAAHVYYGSPYPGLRARLAPRMESLGGVPPVYELHLPRAASPGARVDASNGLNSAGKGHLREGSVPQRLLQALVSDFYRPLGTVELHESVHPDQYFHPVAAPERLRKALTRLDSWMKQEGLALRTHSSRNLHALKPSGKGCAVRILRESLLGEAPGPAERPRGPVPGKPTVALIEFVDALKQGLLDAKAPFTPAEAATALGLPARTLGRHLKLALETGLVERSGRGRYRVKA
ncbi:MAG: helix-turn-helix transcriptional regulator [Bdellovibrionales bacterium]|nr:helix-turn-helix transcriptional regulator [Bdellovibrionales bacterium]